MTAMVPHQSWADAFFELFIETDNDPLPQEGRPFDVGIAIGIGLNANGTGPSPRSAGNALQVLEWHRQGLIENVLVVGGASVNGLTEAAAMRQLIQVQLPQNRLFGEERSTTTWSNALNSLVIIKERGWQKILIAAEALHAGRVRGCFRKAVRKVYGVSYRNSGLDIRVRKVYSPYGNSSGWFTSRPSFCAYNLAAYAYYKLIGYA